MSRPGQGAGRTLCRMFPSAAHAQRQYLTADPPGWRTRLRRVYAWRPTPGQRAALAGRLPHRTDIRNCLTLLTTLVLVCAAGFVIHLVVGLLVTAFAVQVFNNAFEDGNTT